MWLLLGALAAGFTIGLATGALIVDRQLRGRLERARSRVTRQMILSATMRDRRPW